MFTLPELPYRHNALEPYIDEQTMHLHHEGHHQAYVNKLNDALADYPEWQDKDIETLLTHLDRLPEEIQTTVRNNGGGHYNHSFTWQEFIPASDAKDPMSFEVGNAIVEKWGSFEAFQKDFNNAATTRFGSGYAWLVVDHGDLMITSTPNQDNPLMNGQTPIMELDVWEHAYYLTYNNRRPEYIDAFWNILNWEFINEQYMKAMK